MLRRFLHGTFEIKRFPRKEKEFSSFCFYLLSCRVMTLNGESKVGFFYTNKHSDRPKRESKYSSIVMYRDHGEKRYFEYRTEASRSNTYITSLLMKILHRDKLIFILDLLWNISHQGTQVLSLLTHLRIKFSAPYQHAGFVLLKQFVCDRQ